MPGKRAERASVPSAEGTKLCHRLQEDPLVAPPGREGRVSVSKTLEARCTPIGGELTDALGAEEAPTAFCNLPMGVPFQALELFGHRIPHLRGPVALRQSGRHRERKCGGLRPLRVARTEVHIGAGQGPRAAPELLRECGDTGPVARMADQTCLDGIGHHVSELLHDGLVSQQPNDRGLLRVPGRAFPLAQDLGA